MELRTAVQDVHQWDWLISLVQEEVPGVLSTAVQLRTALSVGAPMGADRPALCVKDYWGAQHSVEGHSRVWRSGQQSTMLGGKRADCVTV